jgi:hypothetical protein
VILTVVVAAILAALALLVAPPHAHGNFAYWSNLFVNSIGRAKINGTGANNSFISGLPSSPGPAASSFSLPVKPLGKTAKKLNKQIKKQLRMKRKAKAKVGVTVFIHYIPVGVAGVPNTQQLKVTLVRQHTKKKK